jgi:hypothetical protein
VPSNDETRKELLQGPLEDLITHAVKDLILRLWKITKPATGRPKAGDLDKSESIAQHYANNNINDEIALKCAIQFCISIGANKLLFGDLY